MHTCCIIFTAIQIVYRFLNIQHHPAIVTYLYSNYFIMKIGRSDHHKQVIHLERYRLAENIELICIRLKTNDNLMKFLIVYNYESMLFDYIKRNFILQRLLTNQLLNFIRHVMSIKTIFRLF